VRAVTAAPPDGLIARRYSQLETGLTDGGRAYMYQCLLRGMRSEAMPEPKRENKVNERDAKIIRQKAHTHLPAIEEIRAGDRPLPDEPPAIPASTPLPF
jgi:hypothetical protein